MDTNSWRPAQGAEARMDAGDWRTQLQPDSRQRIVNKIMEFLKRHLPISGQEGLQELTKIIVRFEEKIYSAATSQSDYLRKISLKLLTLENKSLHTMANPLTSNPATYSENPPDPASHSMQSQVTNQGQPLPILMLTNQAQVRQQLLSQNNMAATAVQGSASLTPALPPVTGPNQTTMPNAVGQNSNLQNIQSTFGVLQNSVGKSMGQGVLSNIYANTQWQMQGMQQVVPHQQQQQSKNPQHYLYQQQLQQQQLQQNLLQSTQLQSPQQSVMPHSVMQSAPVSNVQQNQQTSVQQSTQPVLQQHPQSNFLQQQTAVRQQQLMVHQPIATNMQENQLINQHNSITEIMLLQQQQQQQRFLSHQNNLSNLLRQQQLMNQQNNLSNIQQQRLGPENFPMASSFGSVNRSLTPYRPLNDKVMYCDCGFRTPLITSYTEKNPGRRFYGCANYLTDDACDFHMWEDEEVSVHYKKFMNGLMSQVRKTRGRFDSVEKKSSNAEKQRLVEEKLNEMESQLGETRMQLNTVQMKLEEKAMTHKCNNRILGLLFFLVLGVLVLSCLVKGKNTPSMQIFLMKSVTGLGYNRRTM